ncbi:hypothetical protein ACWCQE_27660 [Streptomyces sp. NPDC002409]
MQWSEAASAHVWATPTAAQVAARVLAHVHHGTPQHALPTVPQDMAAAIAAFSAEANHAQKCRACAAADLLTDMCPDGQQLLAAAINTVTATHATL